MVSAFSDSSAQIKTANGNGLYKTKGKAKRPLYSIVSYKFESGEGKSRPFLSFNQVETSFVSSRRWAVTQKRIESFSYNHF